MYIKLLVLTCHFISPSANIKAQKNIMHRRQIIDTTLLKCYLQVSEQEFSWGRGDRGV